jgi:nitrite reductase/ring-hydroxylating ferredoxin subunit
MASIGGRRQGVGMLARWLTGLVDAQQGWAVPLGGVLQRWLRAIVRRTGGLRDLLNGRWLGHPLHAAVTDIPIGILGMVIVFDVVRDHPAADLALGVGLLALAGAALAGFADYAGTDGLARHRATVHAALMVVAFVLYLASLGLRVGTDVSPVAPAAVSAVAWLLVLAGAYVGGDVVYALGNMVDRHAFRARGGTWSRLEIQGLPEEGVLPERTPVRAKLGVNTLVLLRSGDTIHALHDTCAHAGAPLSNGRVVGDCLECPWHGSRFRLTDGARQRGPTVYDQPAYEVRRTADGEWEARRKG